MLPTSQRFFLFVESQAKGGQYSGEDGISKAKEVRHTATQLHFE